MELRVAFGHRLTKFAVVAVGLATLLGVYATVTQPECDPERLWQSTQADSRAQQFERAYAGMKRLRDLRPPTEDDCLTLARLAMSTGRTEEALAEFARVSDGHPTAALARLWEGQLELRIHRARDAESSVKRALAIDPSLVEARRLLVYLYGIQRRCDDLSAQFATLAERDFITFDQMSVWCLIGIAPWHPQEILPVLAAFVQADPDDRASRLALAEAFGSLGEHENVEGVLKHLPATDPDARAILARIAHDRGDAEAVESLLAHGSDDHPILQYYRGQLAIRHRDLPAVLGHFRKWTAADPHDRNRLYMLGDALVKSGKYVEGEIYLQAARDHQALYELIERASSEAGRQDLDLLKELGAAYERVGLIPQAKAWYKLALVRDPADAGVQGALYHLGTAAARTVQRQPGQPAHLRAEKRDGPHSPPS
jgi:tetratricopeptide (TPR) repeat protein